ncbi:MAG TPA: carbohydrate kinase family protein [Roseiflexaceae bacterium]|nr:carbohydrate kinase family protein [Roseiflexaceae bacterium]
MSTVFIAGLINVETTIQVETFPIEYSPVRYPFFGVSSTISGVGYNVAKALTTLGDQVRFAALIGRDPAGDLVRYALEADRLPAEFVLAVLEQTPQSAILFDRGGRRQINVDLKDIQDRVYPPERFEQAIAGCDLAVLCNINFARPLLESVRRRGIPIATDVHSIADLDDAYNRDFMAAADILFMSHELLPCSPEEWAQRVFSRYDTKIVVVGLGPDGAALAVRQDGFIGRFPAVHTRPVVNTIGAGDALFSAFVHFYCATHAPYEALQRAITFASYKVGTSGAAQGFLDARALEALHAAVNQSAG